MILVTGGAGFIGSALIKELNLLGRSDILIVDDIGSTDKWLNLRGLEFSEIFSIDNLFANMDEDLLQNLDFIFHIGANSATTEKDMDFLMKNNVDYSKNLFLIARDFQIPIIYASSAATYGDGEQGYSDTDENISKLLPLNPYGFSKQLVDKWVLELKERPAHWFGLKYFNVYGPNEYHKNEMRSLVHKSFEQINEKGFVKLFKSHKEGFEDGEQLRDFVYVKDIVKAMIQMMDPKMASHSGIYNMGTGQARSFKDLIKAVFHSMEREENIDYIDMPENLREQYQYYTQADMSKFSKILPNFKFSTIEEGVADYVQNYLLKSNPYY